ncbi:MAG: hypothetical protein ACK5JF_00095 [Oscillospiraceae bacterium]
MRKQLLAIGLSIVSLFAFYGCSTKVTLTSSGSSGIADSTSATTSGYSLPEVGVEYKDLSFFTLEQAAIYEAADLFTYDYNFGGDFGIEDSQNPENQYAAPNGHLYYKATQKYATYNDFYAFVTSIFTEDYFNSTINEYDSFINKDNILYVEGGERGGSIAFIEIQGYVITNSTSDELSFDLIALNGDYSFTESGEEVLESTYTENIPITFKRANGEWRIDEFDLPY